MPGPEKKNMVPIPCPDFKLKYLRTFSLVIARYYSKYPLINTISNIGPLIMYHIFESTCLYKQ